MRTTTRHGAALSLLWLLACGGGSDGPTIPCADGDARCGRPCDSAQTCPAALYCSDTAVCAKQCSSEHACANAGVCSADGRCSGGTATAGVGGVGGAAGAAGGGGVGAGLGGAGSGGRGNLPGCGDTVVQAMRVTPTVLLIVDQSGSMTEDFETSSRWTALRDSLLSEPDGLISSLQSQVRFGLSLYSARAGDGPVEGMCPLVTNVAPELNNRAAIAATYTSEEPIDETPTGDAIAAVLQQLMLPANFDPIATPIVFVLATDGEPDRCEDPNPEDDADIATAKQEVVDAVTAAFQRGIRTYVISVGSDLSEEHQRAVANAGLGRTAGQPDAEFWRAGDDQSLRMALTEIVGTQISCDVSLNNNVTGDACRGTVTLAGAPLTCNDPNGWQLTDPTHIRLLGSACSSVMSDPTAVLSVSFPCDVLQ
jgi:hypothetical protein